MAWFKYPTDTNQAFAEIKEQQVVFYVAMAKGYTRSCTKINVAMPRSRQKMCGITKSREQNNIPR
jgi:hypothetical protein